MHAQDSWGDVKLKGEWGKALTNINLVPYIPRYLSNVPPSRTKLIPIAKLGPTSVLPKRIGKQSYKFTPTYLPTLPTLLTSCFFPFVDRNIHTNLLYLQLTHVQSHGLPHSHDAEVRCLSVGHYFQGHLGSSGLIFNSPTGHVGELMG